MAGLTNGTTNGEVHGATTNRTALRTTVNGTTNSTVVNGIKKAAKLAEEEELPELDTIEDTIEAFSTLNPFYATSPLLYTTLPKKKKSPPTAFIFFPTETNKKAH